MSCAVNLIGLDGCMIVETLLEDNFHSNRRRLLQCSEGGPFLLGYSHFAETQMAQVDFIRSSLAETHNKMANMA